MKYCYPFHVQEVEQKITLTLIKNKFPVIIEYTTFYAHILIGFDKYQKRRGEDKSFLIVWDSP